MLILIADDDSEDVEIFCDALTEIDPAIECIQVENGEAVMRLLTKTPVELPDFIFLDINMPRMNGKECLAEIKKNEVLKKIPVVMYSTSSDKRDMDACREMGADGYVVKPGDFKGLIGSLTSILT